MSTQQGLIGGPDLTGGQGIPAPGTGAGGTSLPQGGAPGDGAYLLVSADSRLANSKTFPGCVIPSATPPDPGYFWLDTSTSTHVLKYYDASAWHVVDAGAAFMNGSQIYAGSGTPSSASGVDGDYYLNTTTDDFYLKASGAWGVIANFKGTAGTPSNWTGAWDITATYAVSDAVSYGGGSYISILAGTGHQPDTSPTYWNLFAAPGAPGPPGADGIIGPHAATHSAAGSDPVSLTSPQISDFAEAVDDRVAALLIAGANITLTYNDVANTLTIAAAGSGGGGGSGVGDLLYQFKSFT